MDLGWARQWPLNKASERVKVAMGMAIATHCITEGVWDDACPRAIWEADRIERRREVLAQRAVAGEAA